MFPISLWVCRFSQEYEFYYLQSRYYDSAVGRFLNADIYTSTGQGILGNNMYTYCQNMPVCCSDKGGYLPVSELERHGEVDIPIPPKRNKKKTQKSTTTRDVTKEVTTALEKATERALNYRKTTDKIFGDSVCSDAFVYTEFYNLVNHEADWDIKVEASWEKTIGTKFPGKNVRVKFGDVAMTPEELGNFSYGVLGYAYGIPETHLVAGSFYAAGAPTSGASLANEVYDWIFVMAGYNAAKSSYIGG